jgi:hypothetical protein
MDDPSTIVVVGDPAEVGDVLSHDGASLALSGREDVAVGQCTQIRAAGYSLDLPAACTQPIRNHMRVHLIEK